MNDSDTENFRRILEGMKEMLAMGRALLGITDPDEPLVYPVPKTGVSVLGSVRAQEIQQLNYEALAAQQKELDADAIARWDAQFGRRYEEVFRPNRIKLRPVPDEPHVDPIIESLEAFQKNQDALQKSIDQAMSDAVKYGTGSLSGAEESTSPNEYYLKSAEQAGWDEPKHDPLTWLEARISDLEAGMKLAATAARMDTFEALIYEVRQALQERLISARDLGHRVTDLEGGVKLARNTAASAIENYHNAFERVGELEQRTGDIDTLQRDFARLGRRVSEVDEKVDAIRAPQITGLSPMAEAEENGSAPPPNGVLREILDRLNTAESRANTLEGLIFDLTKSLMAGTNPALDSLRSRVEALEARENGAASSYSYSLAPSPITDDLRNQVANALQKEFSEGRSRIGSEGPMTMDDVADMPVNLTFGPDAEEVAAIPTAPRFSREFMQALMDEKCGCPNRGKHADCGSLQVATLDDHGNGHAYCVQCDRYYQFWSDVNVAVTGDGE